MSFGNSYGGGRTRSATRVYLNVYDLIPQAPPAQQQQPGISGQANNNPSSNNILSYLGCGLHHTGVEIMGTEYSFSNNGVFTGPPKMIDPSHAVFKQQIDMGTYDGGSAELKQAIQELESNSNDANGGSNNGNFGPGQYNAIKRNCNHFSNALCWKLLRKTIPPHINRLADLGSCLSCLLPRQLLENAPVGSQNGTNASNSTSNSVSSIQMQRGSSSAAATKPAFTGTGQALGGDTSSSNSSSSSRQQENGLFSRVFTTTTTTASSSTDDALERRERARKAALARLERSEQDSKSQ